MAGAQKTDAFAHNLQDTAAQLQALPLGFSLLDAQDQVFFLQAVGIGYIQIAGHCAKIAQGSVFQFNNFHGFQLDVEMVL